ncbi:MAG: DUF58 domain-containing protein [Planctomycetota bacterium]
MSSPADIFGDEDFLKTLSYLDLTAKQIRAGSRRGERASRRTGSGTLFRDYRSYSRGDDLRYVDWNIYGRLDSLFVKVFEVEESADVLLFVDRSLSMDFGTPTKLDFARRIAAALGYIALSHLDQVTVVPVPGNEIRSFSGKLHAPALFSHLLEQAPEGETDLYGSVRRALGPARRSRLAIVISDLLDPQGWQRAVEYLLHRRHRVFLVHVVSAEEEEPELSGSLRLLDSETGRIREVRVTDQLLEEYREVWSLFCSRAESFARRREIGHARVRSDLPFGPAVLTILRRGGVVR